MNLIDISDHPILGLKRKVSWDTFIYSENEQIIKVFTVCHCYYNDNGRYGEPFMSNIVKDFQRVLIASNIRQVNPLTGDVCNQNDNGIWIDLLGNTIDKPIGQFEFFRLLINNKSVDIPGLIESAIIQEDTYFHNYN